jgi:hypothetical protein
VKPNIKKKKKPRIGKSGSPKKSLKIKNGLFRSGSNIGADKGLNNNNSISEDSHNLFGLSIESGMD